MGKSRRKPFSNLSNNRYAPLNAISSDTSGPISQEDIDGNKFLQLIADAGTKYFFGAARKTKGGAANFIIKSLNRLQVLCGRTAKILNTGGEKEEDAKYVKKLLPTQGKTHTHTAPGSSQSNAVVVRRFEGVFAAARTSLKAALPPLNGKEYWSLAARAATQTRQEYRPRKAK